MVPSGGSRRRDGMESGDDTRKIPSSKPRDATSQGIATRRSKAAKQASENDDRLSSSSTARASPSSPAATAVNLDSPAAHGQQSVERSSESFSNPDEPARLDRRPPPAIASTSPASRTWSAFERYHSPRNSLPDYSPESLQDPDAVPLAKHQMVERLPPIVSMLIETQKTSLFKGAFRPHNTLATTSNTPSTKRPRSRDGNQSKVFDLVGNSFHPSNTNQPSTKRARIEGRNRRGASPVDVVDGHDRDDLTTTTTRRRRRTPSITHTANSSSPASERRVTLGLGIPEYQQLEDTLRDSKKRRRGLLRASDGKRRKVYDEPSDDEIEVEDVGPYRQQSVERQSKASRVTLGNQTSKYFSGRRQSDHFDDFSRSPPSTTTNGFSRDARKRHQMLKAKGQDNIEEMEPATQKPRRDLIDRPSSESVSHAGAIKPTLFQRARRPDKHPTSPAARSERIRLRSICTDRNDKACDDGIDELILVLKPSSDEFETVQGDLCLSRTCPALTIKPMKIRKAQYAEELHRVILSRATGSDVTSSRLLVELADGEEPGRLMQKLLRFNPNIEVSVLDSDRINTISSKLLKEARSFQKLGPSTLRDTEPSSNSHSDLPVPRNEQPKRSQGIFLAAKGIAKRMLKRSPSADLPSPRKLVEQSRLQTRKPESSSPLREKTYSTRSSTGALRSRLPSPPSPEKWSRANPNWREHWGNSLIYPAEGKKKATVDIGDIERLDEGEFLNDNLIAFYLRYLEHRLERENPSLAKQIYFQNTFFYEALTKSTKTRSINYEAVQRWTAKVDLFSYNWIIVPVNESSHWFLAIICNTPALLNPLVEVVECPPVPSSPSAEQRFREENLSPKAKAGARVSPGSDVASSMQRMSIDDLASQAGKAETASPSRARDEDERSKKTGWDGLDEPASSSVIDKSPTKLGKRSKRKSSLGLVRKLNPAEPRIITLDSLGLSHSPVCVNLREYLKAEAMARQQVDIAASIPQNFGFSAKSIPLQDNYCDCGVYVLAYVEKFLNDPEAFVRDAVRKEMDPEVYWKGLSASNIRVELRDLIFSLQEEQSIRELAASEAKRQAKKSAKKVRRELSNASSPESKAASDTSTKVSTAARSPPAAAARVDFTWEKEARSNQTPEVKDTESDEASMSPIAGEQSSPSGTKDQPLEILESQHSLARTQESTLQENRDEDVAGIKPFEPLPESPNSPSLLGSP